MQNNIGGLILYLRASKKQAMEPSRPARAPAAAQLSPERVRPPDGSDGGESDDDSGVVVMTLDAFLSAGLDKASLEECPICFELKTDVEMLPHADELAQGQASDGRDVSSHKACATCRASLMKNDEQTCELPFSVERGPCSMV